MKKPLTIHLTGGGPGAMLALRRHFKAALAEVESKKPLVAYVGAASNDNAAFFTMIKGALALGAGKATMRLVKAAAPRASASDARKLLDECDLIFFSGGDVDHGMKVLHEKDLVKPIKVLAKGGKPMFGISAGSLMLARDWVRFPDTHPSEPVLFPCLGVAPIHADAHAEEDNWDELRVLVDLVRRRGDEEPLGYGLTRKGGLRIDVDASGVKLRPLGTDIPRIGVRKGKIVDLSALPL